VKRPSFSSTVSSRGRQLRLLGTDRREAAEFFLDRIERLNSKIGAFMTLSAERALEDAGRLERLPAPTCASLPLYGIPFSLKDLTWTKGIRTTLGSKNFGELCTAR
jgi:Asp-tRNA(Asn)/Glu-tRNA(Gln) amidotransferase A subunit family amidase